MKKRFFTFLIATGLLLTYSQTAYAYIDPTTTTFLAQAIAGIIAVVGSAALVFWRRAKKKMSQKMKIDENRGKEYEDEFAVKVSDDQMRQEEDHPIAKQ